MLNKEYCGRCEEVITPQDSYYVARAGWERFLKRRGWRWTRLGWMCPDCLKVEAEEVVVAHGSPDLSHNDS